MKTLLTYQKLIVALFAIVFTLTLHGVSDAQTYTHIYIDAVNGSNAPTGRGSEANPYQSITFALLISERNNLPDPWHVHIHPGSYNGDAAKGNAREIFPLKLRREMIFEGTTTAQECIIDARHLGATRVEILLGLDSESVTIRNLTIQNMNRTTGSAAGGITLWSSAETIEDFSTIEGCVVHNNNPSGVRANVPLILTGNTFSNNGLGLGQYQNKGGVLTSKNVVTLRNTFSNNGERHLFIQGNSVGDISDNIFAHGVRLRGRSDGGSPFRIGGTLTGNITGNTFDRNSEGIFVAAIVGDVTDNIFTGNGSFGFYVTRLTGNVTQNTFTNNGGGFYVREYLTGNVTHNTFTGNDSGREFYTGGGFGVQWGLRGNVTHNTFTSNKGTRFGGFYTNHLTGNVTHNVFDSNSAKEDRSSYACGGFFLGEKPTNVEVSNNIFYNNISGGDGGAVRTQQPTHFKNNLFIIHDAPSKADGAVWLSSPECQFHNNIFSGMDTAIYTADPFDLLITHNLFHNIGLDMVSQGGSGLGNDLDFWELLATNARDNLSGDPLLVSPVISRDFHLQSTSPAIDAGTNAFAPTDDLDGVTRPVGAIVDIGPYEYGGTPVVTTQDPPADDDTSREPADDTPPAEPTLKLYWVTVGKIQRADLDGTNIEDVINHDNREVRRLALDATNGKVYWSERNNGIFRANLADGTNIEHLIKEDVGYYAGGRIALDVIGGEMYWTNGETDSIFRANLDGTNVTEILKLPVGSPVDIALDVSGGKMYWTQWDGNASISRADLDGSNVEPLINASEIGDIALDVSGGKMYWTDGFDGIGMANLDGSNVTNFETPDYITGGITLNLSNGTMYWIDGEGSEIRRGNLDGSQQRTISKSGFSDIDLYIGVPSSTTVSVDDTYPNWDVNEDGKTDITDLVLVAAALGSSSPENPRADVNGDGSVNIQDLILVATHLGESAAPAAPVLVTLSERLTPETLQQVLDLLRMQNDGSVAFQHAIANVEQLLASLLPKETALLANYPNPFNPETWIPYQLASPAGVTLRIHAIDGTLVRTLSLGHKTVGTYQNRSRAAYWDGKNELGESVASGVYFYTLTADDFTATRKMLIRK